MPATLGVSTLPAAASSLRANTKSWCSATWTWPRPAQGAAGIRPFRHQGFRFQTPSASSTHCPRGACATSFWPAIAATASVPTPRLRAISA
jgi:hypothetical protein